ncbi:MAG: porin family protein [bacterium]|nr:porin family protein [bacterium]
MSEISSHPDDSFIGGFWFQLKMNKKWTAQTELLLLDKGIGALGGKSAHFVTLHYFEIPVLFQYHKKKIYFEFGPGLGYMINNFETLNGISNPELTTNHPFSRSELSFNVGIGCKLNEKWALGLRLSHSLLPVRGAVPLVSKESYNRLLALSLTRQLKKKKASDPQE